MKSFALAALVILTGTFIVSINANSPAAPQIRADILEKGLQEYVQQKSECNLVSYRSAEAEKDQLVQSIEDLKRDRDDSNKRIDGLDERLITLENLRVSETIESLQKKLEEIKEKQSDLDGKLVSFSKVSTDSSSVGKSVGSVGSASKSSSHIPPASTKYSARWSNNDGLSDREHAEKMHGINTIGLTDDQIALMRDRDHDMFGPDHPKEMRMRNAAATGGSVSESQFVSQKTRSKSTVSNDVPMQTKYSASSYQSSSYSTCPPGGCPGNQVRGRGGLLGFGILGR